MGVLETTFGNSLASLVVMTMFSLLCLYFTGLFASCLNFYLRSKHFFYQGTSKCLVRREFVSRRCLGYAKLYFTSNFKKHLM